MALFGKPTDKLLENLPEELKEPVKKLKASQDMWLNQVAIESGAKPTPDRLAYLVSQQNWIIIHQLDEISKKLDKLITK